MKKIIAFTLVSVFSATSAFATTSVASSASVLAEVGYSVFGDSTAATATTAKIGRLSTGVGLSFNTSAASYALITQHKNGVRKYGSASDSTAITWATASKDTVIAVPSAANASSILGAGWSVM